MIGLRTRKIVFPHKSNKLHLHSIVFSEIVELYCCCFESPQILYYYLFQPLREQKLNLNLKFNKNLTQESRKFLAEFHLICP